MTNAFSSQDAAIRHQLEAAVGAVRLELAWEAYESASVAGLCHDGAWEVALGTHQPVDSAEPASLARPPSARHRPATP